jgi:hypothetical protein
MKTKPLFLLAIPVFFSGACAPPEVLDIPERVQKLQQVTETYGPLSVHEGEVEAEAAVRPWSAYWYPADQPILFQGTRDNPAPLEKYDQFVRKVHKKDSGAAAFERRQFETTRPDAWQGLCNAWAKAALLEPEPTKGIEVDGIRLSVGDLKALLIKSYELVEGTLFYGERNNGDRAAEYDDIYADQFHRFVQAELMEKRRAFAMDVDPGPQVWNSPVWRVLTRLAQDPADKHRMNVETWLFMADYNVPNLDYVGTISVARRYTYDLYGYQRPGGAFDVAYGIWTGDSVEDHPDFVTWVPETKAVRRSVNPDVDPAIVDELLAKSRVP